MRSLPLHGCLSSVENGVEAAGISEGGMGCEGVTCYFMSSVEDGLEAAGVSVGGVVRVLPVAVCPLWRMV